MPRKSKGQKGKPVKPKQPQVVIQTVPKKPKKPRKKQGGPKVTPLGHSIREIGSAAGSVFGLPGLGGAVGAGISRIFGQGDYRVKSNTMMNGPPTFAALNQGIKIRNRELIGDVSSNVAFSNTTYIIQPSNPTTFPWLSQIATSFEQYKFHGLVFYYNTTSGSAIASTNNSLGTIGMVTCYDPTAAPFASKRQCEDYLGCVSGVPSANMMHFVECKPKTDVFDRYFVQQNNVLDVEDLKTYDMGVLNQFSVGSQASNVVGELWVSYDVELFTPHLASAGVDNDADHFYANGVVTSNTSPFGTGTVPLRTGSNLGCTLINNVLTFPANSARGLYLLTCVYQNATSLAGAFITVPSSSSNISLYNLFLGDTASNYQPSTAGNIAVIYAFSKTNTSTATVTFSGGGTLGVGPAQFDVFISPLPSTLVTMVPPKEQKLQDLVEKYLQKHLSLEPFHDDLRQDNPYFNRLSKESLNRQESERTVLPHRDLVSKLVSLGQAVEDEEMIIDASRTSETPVITIDGKTYALVG